MEVTREQETKIWPEGKKPMAGGGTVPSKTTAGHDPVNHPKHYTSHPSGIECIEITRHMNFNLGNVFKYIWRAGLKEVPIQDLKKAAWYLNDEITKRETGL